MDVDYCIFPDSSDSFISCIKNCEFSFQENPFDVLKVDILLNPASWQITIDNCILSDDLLEDLSKNLCSIYKLDKVNFLVCDNEDVQFSFLKDYILSIVQDNSFDLLPIFESSSWQFSNNKVSVLLENNFAIERIKQKQIDIFIRNGLKKLNKDIAIEFILSKNHCKANLNDDFITDEYLEALAVCESESNPTICQNGILYGRKIIGEPRSINQIQDEDRKVVVEGIIHRFDMRSLRTGRVSFKFNIYDKTDALIVKMRFDNQEKYEYDTRHIKAGMYVQIMGDVQFDPYERNELVLTPRSIMLLEKNERMDNAIEKRVELHAHSKMSALDSVMSVTDYVKCAARWGHRAVSITDHGVVQAFPEAYAASKKNNIKLILGMEGYLIEDEDSKATPWHIVLLVSSQKGLYNLYKLVSLSHLQHYYKRPRIPRKLLEEYREGLILGSACEAGELYQAILNGSNDEDVEDIAAFYDYLEIQPNGNNNFLVRQGRVESEKELSLINKKIVSVAKKLKKPFVATCDVHYLDPDDELYRRILQGGQGYSDADEQPPVFFRTTEEMFDEFKYLDEEDAKAAIIYNPQKIADSIPEIKPIPDELYSPQISGASDDVKNMAYETAKKLYGEDLPEIVEKRLEEELSSIIGNGFSELYLIAHKLVKKSLDDGYLVGSRGSVGSSFVATMMDITEVNPLLPHYRCPKCKYNEFILDGSYGSGFDLPEKNCPKCSTPMNRDGHNIPFAVFLGFHGDKVPDIDLNFSGEYQANAHKYTEELFGRSNVFKAGTISTIAEKTAAGFARKYYDERGLCVRSARIDSIVPGCTGVKRTTGQHPGGIMVVPRDMDIHFFTPVQRPADDRDSDIITTHFDYHSLGDRLVKLDILGHDDPTIIKMLEDMTGIPAKDLPFNDEKTMSIFSSTEALGISSKDLGINIGTLGIPEFGTRFVRQMLQDTKPKCFSELVRISGYSHGTDVWLNNAQTLIKDGIASVSETISARDDIMIFLLEKNVEPIIAFKTMEDVRKGKGVKEEYQKAMREKNIPEWYIESCQKIKYMFPKAHAVAYVMMAARIAYCKVHYPKEFYAAYFTIRADDFDADIVLEGQNAIKNHIRNIEQKGREASDKEKRLLTILELAYEMNLRKINFKRVDLYESHPTKFIIKGNELLPPLTSLAGLGRNAAINIVKEREKRRFISKEELRISTGISKTVLEILVNHGCLEDLPDSNQTSLF